MRILLTAFDAYDDWRENSSWLTLMELLRNKPDDLDLVTRRYPVDLSRLRDCLSKDLQQPYDAILHLGQSPGTASVKLEAIALNVAGYVEEKGEELPALIPGAATAFRSEMPLRDWVQEIRGAEIPAVVSYHAGTFLCNATMYLAHHHFCKARQRPKIGFIHLPLAPQQVAYTGRNMSSLSVELMAQAVRIALESLHRAHNSRGTAGLRHPQHIKHVEEPSRFAD